VRAACARFVADLCAFVRFPSVGVDPRRRGDVAACAAWLAARLQRAGAPVVEVARTPGHPIVWAAWRQSASAPTLLVYGHYDVQPAAPAAFVPAVRGADLFGRGACDDKGPVLCWVVALERCLAASGRVPLNVVCVFEGEEEHGSPHLLGFLRSMPAELAPDVAVMSDTRMRAPGWPSLIVGTRGSLTLDLDLRRPGPSVHSGQFGGAVPNALEALCRMVAALQDSRGRIAVPDLYARVRPPVRLADAPGDAEILADAGVEHGTGEQGYSAYERTTARPALTVTGLCGGGGEAAIPAAAQARLNLRLVPDQEPAEVERLLRARLSTLVPPGFTLRVREAGRASRPATIDPDNRALRAAAEALRRAFGRAPALLRSGGTIPIVADLQRLFGAPTVLMGFARPADGMHGPDEKVNLPTMFRGAEACRHFLELVA
jgi:acetylornithine deacetylase/succinyl-diaminopimelate desuccinylase-like protein